MPEIEPLAVAAGALASFAIGSVYYVVFAAQLAEVRGNAAPVADEQPPPWRLAVEFGRGLVLAAVVAGLAAQGGIDDPGGGLSLGLVLWIGFPAVLWAGAMLWEGTAPRLAAVHAGDWLIKLIAIGIIVAAWQ